MLVSERHNFTSMLLSCPANAAYCVIEVQRSSCLCDDACKRSLPIWRKGMASAGFYLSVLYSLHVLSTEVNMTQTKSRVKTLYLNKFRASCLTCTLCRISFWQSKCLQTITATFSMEVRSHFWSVHRCVVHSWFEYTRVESRVSQKSSFHNFTCGQGSTSLTMLSKEAWTLYAVVQPI